MAVSVASFLGIPFIFGATSVEPAGNNRTIKVTKELGEGSYELMEVSLPALLCIQTGIRRLSYPPFAKLVQAKRRPVEQMSVGAPGQIQSNEKEKQKLIVF